MNIYSNSKRVKLIIGIIWLLANLISLPELILVETFSAFPPPVLEHISTMLLTSCGPVAPHYYIYTFFSVICLYVLPIILMVITYSRIAITLWRTTIPTDETSKYWRQKMALIRWMVPFVSGSRRPLNPQSPAIHDYNSSKRISSAEQQLQGRRKVAKMLIAVVIVFAICYMPVHLLTIIR